MNSSTTHYITQLHRLYTHLPLRFITLFLQGKKDALVRLENETMNQGEKKMDYHAYKAMLAEVLPIIRDNSQPTRHKHSPALLKGPEPCGLSSLCIPVLYKTPAADTSASQLYCFSELLFKERRPLQQGQSSSAPQSCTVTCQAVAVCSEQMDFPAVGNTSGNRILV